MIRRIGIAIAALVVAAGVAPVSAHGPDPLMGGQRWAQDQIIGYDWRAKPVPPAWLQVAVDAAAADVTASRASRAARFVRMPNSSSIIGYGEPTGCSPAGIACFDRSGAPSSFRMWFRAHGFAFDWGTLRWCQGLATIADGCFDAENAALDELGHVEILGHHVNNADNGDYRDAVVQTVARARPAAGWDAHAFGRCDVARLQLEYDRPSPRDLFSSCLAIPTTTTIAASPASLWTGESTRFTASLRTTGSTANRSLANDPVSGRTVKLQRRLNSTKPWTSIGTMVPSTTVEGSYVLSIAPTATYEWRAVFTPAAGDGIVGSSSGALKVTVSGCSGGGCPSRVVP
jgi:hypothetical protein